MAKKPKRCPECGKKFKKTCATRIREPLLWKSDRICDINCRNCGCILGHVLPKFWYYPENPPAEQET